MFRGPLVWLAILMMSGHPALVIGPFPAENSSTAPTPHPPSSTQAAESTPDAEAEHQLVDLVNRARSAAGAPPLEMDPGLTQAAQAHAGEMAAQQRLSHQFPDEPSLLQRLSKNSHLHLDG